MEGEGIETGLRCIRAARVSHLTKQGGALGKVGFHRDRLGFAPDWKGRGSGTGCVAYLLLGFGTGLEGEVFCAGFGFMGAAWVWHPTGRGGARDRVALHRGRLGFAPELKGWGSGQ